MQIVPHNIYIIFSFAFIFFTLHIVSDNDSFKHFHLGSWTTEDSRLDS